MKNNFDYRKYWIDRLKHANESLTGVGHKRFGVNANRLMYKKTGDVFSDVIMKMKIPIKGKKVLDAGAGIGMFCDFYVRKGARVTAVDISKDALAILKRKYPKVVTKTLQIENISSLGTSQFDIVHCFDVLYHVTDDAKWEKVLKNFATLSKKYIIIHDKYPYLGYQLFEKGHVKVRAGERMQAILGKSGFFEEKRFATHLFYVRPILHLVIAIFPEPFYFLDKALLKLRMTFLQTSYIRVFEKK